MLCWSLFFNKVTGLQACNFVKKETPTQEQLFLRFSGQFIKSYADTTLMYNFLQSHFFIRFASLNKNFRGGQLSGTPRYLNPRTFIAISICTLCIQTLLKSCSIKKLFQKILRNLQEITCAGVSF